MGLRLGLVLPGVALVVQDLRDHERDLEIDAVRRPAGLEQQHAVTAVLREPVGEHAARGSRANDDEVELGVVRNR
ncbi:hypothetical protein D3C83_89400 [compost metagenome]